MPGQTLAPTPSVLVMPVPSRGEDEGQDSGWLTTATLGRILGEHRVKNSLSQEPRLESALEEAEKAGLAYVLRGELTQWEDNVTAWSSNPDKAALALELHEVSTKKIVASAVHRLVGGQVKWGSNSPIEFIPELADHALAKIFGWVPRLYADE